MSGADSKATNRLFYGTPESRAAGHSTLLQRFGLNIPDPGPATPAADENISPLEKIAAEENQIRARMDARKKKNTADLRSALGYG